MATAKWCAALLSATLCPTALSYLVILLFHLHITRVDLSAWTGVAVGQLEAWPSKQRYQTQPDLTLPHWTLIWLCCSIISTATQMNVFLRDSLRPTQGPLPAKEFLCILPLWNPVKEVLSLHYRDAKKLSSQSCNVLSIVTLLAIWLHFSLGSSSSGSWTNFSLPPALTCFTLNRQGHRLQTLFPTISVFSLVLLTLLTWHSPSSLSLFSLLHLCAFLSSQVASCHRLMCLADTTYHVLDRYQFCTSSKAPADIHKFQMVHSLWTALIKFFSFLVYVCIHIHLCGVTYVQVHVCVEAWVDIQSHYSLRYLSRWSFSADPRAHWSLV